MARIRLSYATYTTSVVVNLTLGTATDVTSISNIENVIGGSGNDTITADANANTLSGGAGDDTCKFNNGWGADTVTDSAGNDTLDFSAVTTSLVFNFNGVAVSSGGSTVSYGGIENFIGGTNNDTFIFVDGASVVGNVDGKSGTDTLDFSAMTVARNVVLTSIGSVDGFNGTANGIGGTFNNINNVIASSANSDTLTGANLVTQWSLSAISNTLSAISQLTFSNFETLQGGSAVDTFSITGASYQHFNGGAGDDLLLLNEGAVSAARSTARAATTHWCHHAHIGSHCELGDSHCH